MTLISIKQQLIKAREERYAIPLLDVFDMQGMDGTMDALQAKRAPTIIGVYSPYSTQPNSRALAAYFRCRAEETDIPVSLMLDHGGSVAQCIMVLDHGYTDVMYDGSKLPLEENIANTRRVVEAAHARDAGVEAELGHVGLGDDYEQEAGKGIGFTDPEAVEYFVRETGVDFLAIAFGNAHGLYKGEPHLDLNLLAEIRSRVSVPLVMHGGTGISDEQFRAAITAGISKVNYATNIMNTAAENMKKSAAAPGADMFGIMHGIRDSYCQWATHLFEVFGTCGRA